MNKNEDAASARSGLARDRRNRRSVTLWSLAWSLVFVAVTFGIQILKWPFAAALAGALGTAILGLGTVLAYRRYLVDADELRRKIEVEALALAFGVGVFGGLSCWLLVVSGALGVVVFAYVFSAMVLTHVLGVYLGCRRYA